MACDQKERTQACLRHNQAERLQADYLSILGVLKKKQPYTPKDVELLGTERDYSPKARAAGATLASR